MQKRGAVAIFSDFDGTLAPIVPHPNQARLPTAARRALRGLARKPRVALGVVSGRSLADLRPRVGLRGIWYVASHGEERAGPDGKPHRRTSARLRRRIQGLCRELRARLSHWLGVYVECKTVSVAVHYRNAAPDAAASARRAVQSIVRKRARGFRVLEGKKVREILPPGRASKGRAVFEVLAKMARKRDRYPLLYLGDDVTDETVFQRLRQSDIGIHVGGGTRTRARYRLDSPAEAARFLARLAEAMK